MTRITDRYKLGALVAVQWNPQLAHQFPDIDHNGCYQSMRQNALGKWVPFEPALCHDWHCPNCGKPCGSMGHTACEAQQ